ncbi:uncharacterized protein LOC143423215 [Xylocopa sonorina]|uniref:uncharacterized protein LOC143423215 n=1 Tax=Xylocopa sonorina TaxID=1818115 RepID=UPI00403AF6AA
MRECKKEENSIRNSTSNFFTDQLIHSANNSNKYEISMPESRVRCKVHDIRAYVYVTISKENSERNAEKFFYLRKGSQSLMQFILEQSREEYERSKNIEPRDGGSFCFSLKSFSSFSHTDTRTHTHTHIHYPTLFFLLILA